MKKQSYSDLQKRVKELELSERKRKRMEEAFRDSENKYKILSENIALGFFRSTSGPKGTFIEFNSAFQKILGYKKKNDLYSIAVADIFQNPGERLKYSEKLSHHGFLKNEELILKRYDGKSIIVSETAIAVKGNKGEILYFAGIIEDITDRKRAEKKLQVQKTYLERLFNSAPEAIVLHGNDDLIVDVNDEFVKIFGYSKAEAIGKPINDLLASKDYEEEAIKISENVIRGEKIDLESKRKRKDGSLIDVSILGAPIIHEGKQIGDYAIYRDITERKKSEEEIHIQKTYLERLFNSAPEAIVWHDNNDIVINVNDEFTKTFGYSREEAIGKAINDLVAPPEFLDEASLLSKTVVHGDRVEVETKRKRKNGKLIDVSILGAPIIHQGQQMGVYAIYRDISERKKIEETRIRFREETRMARAIQQKLLPQSNPSVSGYDIAGKNIPAYNVGGDYFDFIELDRYRIAFTLGDVSGKGFTASLVMANLQATIRGQAYYNVAVNECLERSNSLLFRSIDSKTFVSLFYGILDTKEHTITYANAGQNMPFIFNKGKKIVSLKTRGIALGIKEDISYKIETRAIHSGDTIAIYSDGISEAMNSRMSEFGDEKIKRIVKSNLGKSSNKIIELLFENVNKHFGDAPQNDDMTMIVLRRK